MTLTAESSTTPEVQSPKAGRRSGRSPSRRKPTAGFRPDIEGLRALAVLAVLVFHADVPHVAGGFVGVDVFFVISGYLIPGLLLEELARNGRISVRDFYARRARRILPSAATVLVGVCVAGWFLLPPLRLVDVMGDVLSSAVYGVNWRFIGAQTDYMQAGRDASPLLHFWSLAVEEQFYLVWPALVIGAVWLGRRLRRHPKGRPPYGVVGLFTLAVVAGSLWLSLHWTNVSEPLAYLSTPSRAWQFGLGALAGLAVRWGRRGLPLPRPIAIVLGWAGLAAIGYGIVAFDGSTLYPGTAALVPTLGALAVIVAGDGRRTARFGPRLLLARAPMRWIGRLSYSLYLWHWPVLIFAEAKFGALDWPVKLALVLGCLLPAALTVRLIEDPIRFSRSVSARASSGLSVGVTAMVLPVAVALVVTSGAYAAMGGRDPKPVSVPAISLASTAADADPFASGVALRGGAVNPTPLAARKDTPHYPAACIVAASVVSSPPCRLGEAGDKGHVVLIGDSHAGEWFPVVQAVARQQHWSLEVLTKSGCPLPAVSVVNPQLGRSFTECDSWRSRMLERLRVEPKPAAVFVATLNHYVRNDTGLMRGWNPTLSALRALSAPIVYLADTPFPNVDAPTCVSGHLDSWGECTFARSEALRPDPLASAIRSGRQPGVSLVDVNQYLCPSGGAICPMVRGGTLLYRDNSHVTNTAMTMLAPAVAAQLERAKVIAPAQVLATGGRNSGPVNPVPAQARNDWYAGGACLNPIGASTVKPCVAGDAASSTTVVLFGDSHAYEWVPALDVVARQRHWRLVVMAKQGCPAAELSVRNPTTGAPYPECTSWRASAEQAIAGLGPKSIFVATMNRYTRDASTLESAWQPTLAALNATGVPVVYLRDTPYPGRDVPTCVSAALAKWSACAFASSGAVWSDPVAKRLDDGWFPNVSVVDLTDALCPQGTCPAVWSGTLAYLDHSHITATFARQLAPALASATAALPQMKALMSAPG